MVDCACIGLPGIPLKNHKIGHIAEMTLLGLGLVKSVTMSHVKKSSEEPQWRKAYSGLGIVNHLTKS